MRQKFYQLTQSTNARLLKNAHPQLIFSFIFFLQFFFNHFLLQDFEHTWFTIFPRISTILCAPSYVTHNQHMKGMQKQIECQSGKTMQKEEKLAKTKYLQYRLGYRSPPQRKKWRDLNDRVFNLKKSLRIENVNIDDD